MLKEYMSMNLEVPYVKVQKDGELHFLCNNGVLFTKKEYLERFNNKISLSEEYERREKEGLLYDYNYAKSTGLLRKKRSLADRKAEIQKVEEPSDLSGTRTDVGGDAGRKETSSPEGSNGKRELETQIQTARELERGTSDRRELQNSKSVTVICALLAFTSVISMYISTLHTATYLFDYVDMFSAWLMSVSVTAYNGTAFEVSVLFKNGRRYMMSVLFMFLWVLVTAFSMATTVSVFYDRFNFNEAKAAEENRDMDSGKLALELLQKKEADLRDSIAFKKKDMEYRQEREYATAAVRKELVSLEEELQSNLTEQQRILERTPEVKSGETKRKESIFAFLGRLLHIEGGILEFTMSTLSAVFVNLIAPLSLTAVTELVRKKNDDELDKIKQT